MKRFCFNTLQVSGRTYQYSLPDMAEAHRQSFFKFLNQGLVQELEQIFPIYLQKGKIQVNIDTDCRMAMTGAIRKVLQNKPEEFDPRKYLSPTKLAMEEVCLDRLQRFGTEGNADKIKPLTLTQMSNKYLNNELKQIVS